LATNPPSPPTPRVLILSASAGAGHSRAGDALLADLRQLSVPAAHWDILDYATPALKYAYRRGYVHIVDKAPSLWKMMYERSDRPWKKSLARHVEMLNSPGLPSAIHDWNPSRIVCTHFTAACLVSELYARGKVRCPPAVVVTDFDIHAYWLVPHYLRYFIALDESRVYLERFRIDPQRITVSGIPIDPVFRTPLDQPAARRALGLDPAKTTLLITPARPQPPQRQTLGIAPDSALPPIRSSNSGIAPVETLLTELQSLPMPTQIVAIAGKSEALKTRLDTLARQIPAAAPVQIHPVGFTTRMDEYMAAADLLISKPGGLTTCEAMARGLPMCIVNPVPGQEERNADHLLEAGVAIRCNTPQTLAWKIASLLRDPARLDAMRQKARAFGQPFAAQTIVHQLLA
jgi:processive 1,2-diacylglycerol beta-glucosyltransferase